MKKPGLILCVWLSAAAGLFLTGGAAAEVQTITTGKSLYLSCKQALIALDKGLEQLAPGDRNDAFVCMAYIGGVLATAQHANELARLRHALASGGQGEPGEFQLYCFNWQLPPQQVARLVLAYAQRYPKLLNASASELILRALQSTYPCR